MQHQPPDRNNPANPLFKVAALTLDKDFAGPKTRVLLTLNFKRSHDMRGQTRTKYGKDVTVCFSLAIKRASLELDFVFEGAANTRPPIKIEKVSYLRPVHAQDRITSEIAVRKSSSRKFSGKLRAALAAAPAKISAGLGAGGEAAVSSANETASKRRTARSIVRSNIAATYAGNLVHWEIEPNMVPDEKTPTTSWLQGELFKAPNGTPLDACMVSWRQGPENEILTILASVFVTMADLVVDDLKIQTEDGDNIPFSHLDTSHSTLEVLSGVGAKERILRQIIRKHLVAQGMKTEGSRVQICKAYT